MGCKTDTDMCFNQVCAIDITYIPMKKGFTDQHYSFNLHAGCSQAGFSQKSFEHLIARENGFASIALIENEVFIAVDRIRTFPLYFAEKEGDIYISDDTRYIKKKIGCDKIDENASLEFYQAGFVSGNKTLYKEILKI